MIKGCIFDLDGTLINSLEDLANSTNDVLQSRGYKIHPVSAYNYFVGNGVRKLVERALPDNHKNETDECLQEFYKIYEQRCLEFTYCYEGICELLNYLKQNNVQLAVVTNKPHHLAVKICEHYFKDTFLEVVGNKDEFPLKPEPMSTLYVLDKFQVSLDECVFIGDSNVDIYTGTNAKMKTIGVTWGFRTYQELNEAGATYVVNKPCEIKEIVDESRN